MNNIKILNCPCGCKAKLYEGFYPNVDKCFFVECEDSHKRDLGSKTHVAYTYLYETKEEAITNWNEIFGKE